MDTHVRLVAEVLRDLLVDGLETLAVTAPWCRERNNDVLVRVLEQQHKSVGSRVRGGAAGHTSATSSNV